MMPLGGNMPGAFGESKKDQCGGWRMSEIRMGKIGQRGTQGSTALWPFRKLQNRILPKEIGVRVTTP